METIRETVPEQKQKGHSTIFSLFEGRNEIEDYGEMDTFGVTVLMTAEPEKYYHTIENISPDKKYVQEFIAYLISHEVSTIHVYDVLFNYLEEF